MNDRTVSTLSAKDKRIIRNIYNPEQRAADARYAKRQAILNEAPLRLTWFGWLVLGIIAGALTAMLIAFVISVTGLANGIAVALGVAMFLGTIGATLADTK